MTTGESAAPGGERGVPGGERAAPGGERGVRRGWTRPAVTVPARVRSPRRGPGRRRDATRLHPLAWWAWAAGLSVAAWRTTDPLLLVLIVGVVVSVVSLRRSEAAWSGALRLSLRFAVVVVVLRVGLQLVFGARVGGNTLFALPRVPLPSWAAGVSIGGPVTLEALVGALYLGCQLAVVLICFGAANSLASPYRLLRCLPSVFYEAGVAVTVALSFTPAAVVAAHDLRAARRLRGRPVRGVAGIRGMAVPVLEGTLERALDLAASMDARGYGRHRRQPGRTGRLADGATALGLLAVAGGIFGVLDQSGAPPALGPVLLSIGVLALLAGLSGRGRRTSRSRYRPDRWTVAEWVTLAAGVAVAVGFVAHPAGLHPSTSPVVAPGLPAVALLAVAAALLPILVTSAPLVAGADPYRPHLATTGTVSAGTSSSGAMPLAHPRRVTP